MLSMNNAQFTDLCAWIAEAGLAGQSEVAALDGFCERALEVGLPLARANVVIDTLHPVYEGRAFVWKRKTRNTSLTEFGRGTVDMHRWENSPYYYLELSGEPMLRRRLTPETRKRFSDFHRFARRRHHRLSGDNQSLRRGRNRRRYGLRLFILGDGCSGRISRCRCDRPRPAYAFARAHLESRLPGPHRRHPGRDLPRARCRTPRACRPHRPRRHRSDRSGLVVQRSAQLHAHQRQRGAGRNHSNA